MNAENAVEERNTRLIKHIITELTQWPHLLPIGQLAVYFHAANSLGVDWGSSSDKAEQRNCNYLKSINPRLEGVLINAIISGSFKPDLFIHPFEEFHSTPGYQDPSVLPEFFAAVDSLAKQFKSNRLDLPKEEFLSFVYMFFLIIHPFIDGNGRVARNLLDYYNQALSLKLKPVWNNEQPKFCKNRFHKESFQKFFLEDAKIKPYQYDDVFSYKEVSSLLVLRKTEAAQLSECLIQYSKRFRTSLSFDSPGINLMANGIRKLQQQACVQ